MKFIKLALISGVILCIVIFLFSLIIPSHIRISRAVNISISKDSLLPAITDLRQWKEWNLMVNNPEFTNKQYTDHSFTSDQVKITKQGLEGDTLLTTWQQPNERKFISGFTWHGREGHLVVQWYFDIQLRWYPWEKFSSIIFDKQLGPPMEKSLDNLKKLLEKNP
jgi:hypothetical protein